jgi:small subunit ribosomal protein S2
MKEVVKLLHEWKSWTSTSAASGHEAACPARLFVVDPPARSHNAIAEARKLHIPIVAIDRHEMRSGRGDYVIPAMTTPSVAIRLISATMANAIEDGPPGRGRRGARCGKPRTKRRRPRTRNKGGRYKWLLPHRTV